MAHLGFDAAWELSIGPLFVNLIEIATLKLSLAKFPEFSPVFLSGSVVRKFRCFFGSEEGLDSLNCLNDSFFSPFSVRVPLQQ